MIEEDKSVKYAGNKQSILTQVSAIYQVLTVNGYQGIDRYYELKRLNVG